MMSADRRYFCVIGNSLKFSITQKGTFFFKFILKLVDCLEKCLICRHIRRFAD